MRFGNILIVTIIISVTIMNHNAKTITTKATINTLPNIISNKTIDHHHHHHHHLMNTATIHNSNFNFNPSSSNFHQNYNFSNLQDYRPPSGYVGHHIRNDNEESSKLLLNQFEKANQKHQNIIVNRLLIHPSILSSDWRNQFQQFIQQQKPVAAADRRLFFSFNQLLLSLVAPRLMRYQFDLMMHSVLSELFRKVFVPAIGTSIRGGVQSSTSTAAEPLFSLSNLLRNRQNQQQNHHQPQHYPPTSNSPNLDLQKLLDNAQKLITLQTLIRNGQQQQKQQQQQSNNKEKDLKAVSQNAAANDDYVGNIDDGTNAHHPNEMSSKIQPKTSISTDNHNNQQQQRPIHLTVSPKDFIDFIRQNWQQKTSKTKTSNEEQSPSGGFSSANDNDNVNANHHHLPIEMDNNNIGNGNFRINQHKMMVTPGKSFEGAGMMMTGHNNNNDEHSASLQAISGFGDNLLVNDINKMKSSFAFNNYNSKSRKKFNHQKNNPYKQKAKLEDFKMSHLTYIDTEVPNYGNQLLIDDPENENNNDKQQFDVEQFNTNNAISNYNSLSSTSSFSKLFESTRNYLQTNKPLSSNLPPKTPSLSSSSMPHVEDLERANRWNNVLSNMIRRFSLA